MGGFNQTYLDVENRTKGDESEKAATPEASRLAVIEKRMVEFDEYAVAYV